MNRYMARLSGFFTRRQIIVLGIAVFAAAVSLLFYIFSDTGERRLFLFPDVKDGSLCFEARYLRDSGASDTVEQYVRELLLGPSSTAYRPLFPAGTQLLSCFLRSGCLYVNLSGQALLPDGKAVAPLEGYEIFKKNVFTNFKKVDTIELYIMNEKAYDEPPQVQ